MSFKPIDPQDVLHLMHIDIPASASSKGHFYIPCMFCNDHSKHLNINIEKGVYYCRRCTEHGSILQLYGKLHTPPLYDYKEICDEIREHSGISDNAIPRRTIVRREPTPLADISKRDKAYRALLSLCELRKEHRNDLLRRGLRIKDIKDNMYKSTPTVTNDTQNKIARKVMDAIGVDALEGIPGFYLDADKHWAIKKTFKGYFIPYMDIDGNVQGMQIRTDPEERESVKKKSGTEVGKYIWFTSSNVPKGGTKGTTVSSYVHVCGTPTRYEILTEGGLKADTARSLLWEQYGFIAIAGVNATKELKNTLLQCKEHGTEHLLMALDMDMHENHTVMAACTKIRELTEKCGLKVSVLQWQKGKGIDDFLIAYRDDESLVMQEYPPFF